MVGVAPVNGLRDWKVEFDRWLAEHDREVTAAARDFLVSALEESDADEGDGWDVEVDARTVLALLPPVEATPDLHEGDPK